MGSNEADLVEVRLDSPELMPAPHLADELRTTDKPLLFTARHPDEGAFSPLSAEERSRFLQMALPKATLIDVELRSLPTHAKLIDEAKQNGVAVVISHHDFSATPTAADLEKTARAARAAGADIVKIACYCVHPTELARLLAFFADQCETTTLALMGMGPLGPISRLLFATLGSRLNYGAVGIPQVPGQWPAALLKSRISELAGRPPKPVLPPNP